MLTYFTEYQLGLIRGLPYILDYILLIAMIAFALNDFPRNRKEWLVRIIEMVLCWGIMQFISAGYYAVAGETNFNQFRELGATLLYAATRSRYPLSKRFVIACSFWSARILFLGSIGFFPPFSMWGLLGLMAVFMPILVWFLHRFSVDEFKLSPSLHITIITSVGLCGAVSSANWPIPNVGNVFLLMANLAMLVTLLLLYYLFYSLNVNYLKNLEMAVILQRQKLVEDTLAMTNKNRDEMRILRHELKNHDAYIRYLLQQKQYDKLDEYLKKDDVSSLVQIKTYVDSGNQLVDAMINQKIALAESAGVKVDCKLAVPAELPYSEVEFGSLLANLFDNAIEAASKAAQEKLIHFQISLQRGYLFIHMENPFPQDMTRERRLSLVTSKGDSTRHGYGTKVVKRVADKYNGCVEYTIHDNMFCCDVMLAVTEQGGNI